MLNKAGRGYNTRRSFIKASSIRNNPLSRFNYIASSRRYNNNNNNNNYNNYNNHNNYNNNNNNSNKNDTLSTSIGRVSRRKKMLKQYYFL